MSKNRNKVQTRQAIVEAYVGETEAYYNDKKTELYKGLSLKNGNSMVTGASSDIYLKVDSDKSVKLEENSKMVVNKLTNKELELNLLYGDFHFNVENKLKDDEKMEFTAGQTTMSIRGTQGHGSYHPELERLEFYVYAGKVEIEVAGKKEEIVAGKKLIVEEEVITTEEYHIEDIQDGCKEEIIKKDENIDRVVEAFIEDAHETISKEEIKEELKHMHNMSIIEHDARHHVAKCSSCDYEVSVDHSKTNNVTIEVTKPATTVEEGYYTVKCKDCNETWTVVIPKLEENTPDDPTPTNPVITTTDVETTETEETETSGTITTPADEHLVHNWVYDSDTRKYDCQSGEIVYVCSGCDETKTETAYPLCDHNVEEYETIKEATPMEDGIRVGTCSICNEQLRQTIERDTYDCATITVFGAYLTYDGSEEKYDYLVVPYNTEVNVLYDDSIKAEFEYYQIGDTIITDKNFTLLATSNTDINVKYKDVTPNYVEEIIVEATCDSTGLKRITDTVTGTSKTVEYTGMSYHNYGEQKVLREATCDTDGYSVKICKNCGHEEYDFIKASGHTYEFNAITATASGKLLGTKEYRCTVCDESKEVQYAAPLYPTLTNKTIMLDTSNSYSGSNGTEMRDEEIVNYGNTTLYYRYTDKTAERIYFAYVDNGENSPIYLKKATGSGASNYPFSNNGSFSNWAIYGYADSVKEFYDFIYTGNKGQHSNSETIFTLLNAYTNVLNSRIFYDGVTEVDGELRINNATYGDWRDDTATGFRVRSVTYNGHEYVIDENYCCVWDYQTSGSTVYQKKIVAYEDATEAKLGMAENVYSMQQNGQSSPKEKYQTTFDLSEVTNVGYYKITCTDCYDSNRDGNLSEHYSCVAFNLKPSLNYTDKNNYVFNGYEVKNAKGEWVALDTSSTYAEIAKSLFGEVRTLEIRASYSDKPKATIKVENAYYSDYTYGSIYDEGEVYAGTEVSIYSTVDTVDHWEVTLNGVALTTEELEKIDNGSSLNVTLNDGDILEVKAIEGEPDESSMITLEVTNSNCTITMIDNFGSEVDLSEGKIPTEYYRMYFNPMPGYVFMGAEFTVLDGDGSELEVSEFVNEYDGEYTLYFYSDSIAKVVIDPIVSTVTTSNYVTVTAPDGYYVAQAYTTSYGFNGYGTIAKSISVPMGSNILLVTVEDGELTVADYVLVTLDSGRYAVDCTNYNSTGGIAVRQGMTVSIITSEEYEENYVAVDVNAAYVSFTANNNEMLSGKIAVEKNTTLYISYPQGTGISALH